MAPRLALAVLLLQYTANAFNFPKLNPQPTKVFNHIKVAAVAAAEEDPAITACSIAYYAVSSCAAIDGLTDAPAATQAACICCVDSVEVDEYYGSCASYIRSNVPRSSDLYSAYSGLASVCREEVPTCGVGAAATPSPTDDSAETETPTPRPPRTSSGGGIAAPTTTRPSGGAGGIPPECTSLTAILESCLSATPALTDSTARDSDAASCVCYTTSGRTSTYTTEVDDLASECAPWARTAATSAYSGISALQTFCAEYTPSSSDEDDTPTETTPLPLTPTPRPTITGGGLGGGGGSGSIQTTATTPRAVATTTSSQSPNPAAHASPGGLMVWVANMMTLVVSFFFLV